MRKNIIIGLSVAAVVSAVMIHQDYSGDFPLFFPKAEHVHEYDHCFCECGDVEYTDTDDKTVIVSEKDLSSFEIWEDGSVFIPDTVERNGEQYTVVGLGNYLFQYNDNITSVEMPDTVKYIGVACFKECSNLVRADLPEGLETIEYGAFELCTSLRDIKLPESLRYISDFAFAHCSGVENSEIVISKNLIQLGKIPRYPTHMFYNCGKDDVFTRFVVDEGNPAYKSVDGILYTKDGETLVSIPRGKVFDDGVYEMPDTVKYLGELSSSRNLNLKTVVISDNLIVDANRSSAQGQFNQRENDLNMAFYGYSGVEAYQAKNFNPRYSSVDGVLYSKNLSTVIAVPPLYEGVLSVPEGTLRWNKCALYTNYLHFVGISINRISEIQIPESLRYIEEEQVEIMNGLFDLYGTRISVAEGNRFYQVNENGHLESKK